MATEFNFSSLIGACHILRGDFGTLKQAFKSIDPNFSPLLVYYIYSFSNKPDDCELFELEKLAGCKVVPHDGSNFLFNPHAQARNVVIMDDYFPSSDTLDLFLKSNATTLITTTDGEWLLKYMNRISEGNRISYAGKIPKCQETRIDSALFRVAKLGEGEQCLSQAQDQEVL